MTQDEGRTTITARDLKVVSALQCNGRMTMQALADKIGISVYAATESYKRLTDAGIMTIVPVCNPLSLGNYSQVLVGLRINDNRNEALAMLKAMPQVTYVVCTLGDADIIAEAVVYSADGMDHFLKYDLRALPGLTRLQVFSCGRLVLDDHNVSVVNRLLAERGETGFMTKREASVGTDIPVHRLDARFVHTFNELQKDGRASYAMLGEHLGVTHTAIRGRVKKTGGFRCDAHYGHGKPHAFRRIPPSVSRHRCEASVSPRRRTVVSDRRGDICNERSRFEWRRLPHRNHRRR